MPSLHDISTEIENALTALDDFDGPEEERQAVESALAPYLDDLAKMEADKVDAIAFIDRRSAKEIDFLKSEENRIRLKRQSLERRRASFRDFLRMVMVGHGLKKLSGHTATMSLRSSESVQLDVSPQELPTQYVEMTVTYQPRKADIKAALKAGEVIPGCSIATNQTVQVR